MSKCQISVHQLSWNPERVILSRGRRQRRPRWTLPEFSDPPAEFGATAQSCLYLPCSFMAFTLPLVCELGLLFYFIYLRFFLLRVRLRVSSSCAAQATSARRHESQAIFIPQPKFGFVLRGHHLFFLQFANFYPRKDFRYVSAYKANLTVQNFMRCV